MSELYVNSTILYVRQKPDRCNAHTKTKEKVRLTDGVRHKVTVKKANEKD